MLLREIDGTRKLRALALFLASTGPVVTLQFDELYAYLTSAVLFALWFGLLLFVQKHGEKAALAERLFDDRVTFAVVIVLQSVLLWFGYAVIQGEETTRYLVGGFGSGVFIAIIWSVVDRFLK